MNQTQNTASTERQTKEAERIAHFPTRVIVAIAAGYKSASIRTCDLEKVIKHVVPMRTLSYSQIEKYAMLVLREHVQKQLPFLKEISKGESQSEDQFFGYFASLYGDTLPIKGGSGAFLLEQE